MTNEPYPATTRDTYRHGDLRRALIEAGVELARTGGSAAVVLREATRRVGVVPNAAYRHFGNRDDLLRAVRSAALAAAARTIERELAAIGDDEAHLDRARRELRAVGKGYMRFAALEPGLFELAFVMPMVAEAGDLEKGGASGLDPLQHLRRALDGMVAAGLLPTERRAGAEYLAWSAVHGLAMLVIAGPLHGLPAAGRDELERRLLLMVEAGL